jgi:NADH-quinone oxidoreductase subunit M
MYLIIGIWGGEDRVRAAVKFFLYTFFGSVFLLIALIYMYSQTGTFEFAELANQVPLMSLEVQQYLWLATFISFAVKVPMVPFHTWLPDAHVQAPTAGSVMLAGILLKLGGYAFLRVSLPMLPGASEYFATYVLWVSGFAVIYASLVALAQKDMKKMIAYSSVAHMGYVTAGIFSLTVSGINGAVFQMISHGLISSALFLVVGMLYERHHTKEISRYGGVATSMPILATFFMIAMLGSVGLPGLSGFVGEFLSIVGTFDANPAVGIICAFGVILGAVYMLKLYKCVMFGEVSDKSIIKFSDLKSYEIAALVPLMFLIIYIGVLPAGVLTSINIPVENLAGIYGAL